MGRLESQVRMIQLHAITTECALVSPGRDDFRAKVGIAARSTCGAVHFQSNRRCYSIVKRLREMRIQNLSGEFPHRLWPRLQYLVNRDWKAASNLKFPEFGSERILASASDSERDPFLDFPDSIVREVIKGEL